MIFCAAFFKQSRYLNETQPNANNRIDHRASTIFAVCRSRDASSMCSCHLAMTITVPRWLQWCATLCKQLFSLASSDR